MTVEELAGKRFNECLNLLSTKGSDYSSKTDRLANFKVNAAHLGLTKYQVWSVYFMKHVDAVMRAVKDNPEYPQTKSEPIEQRLADIINYAVLGEALLAEDKKETQTPALEPKAAPGEWGEATKEQFAKVNDYHKPIYEEAELAPIFQAAAGSSVL